MYSILRSIQPYYLYLILIGRKSIEVGKKFRANHPRHDLTSAQVEMVRRKFYGIQALLLKIERIWIGSENKKSPRLNHSGHCCNLVSAGVRSKLSLPA